MNWATLSDFMGGLSVGLSTMMFLASIVVGRWYIHKGSVRKSDGGWLEDPSTPALPGAAIVLPRPAPSPLANAAAKVVWTKREVDRVYDDKSAPQWAMNRAYADAREAHQELAKIVDSMKENWP